MCFASGANRPGVPNVLPWHGGDIERSRYEPARGCQILTILLLATAASSQEIDGSYPKESPDGRFILYTEDEEVFVARSDGESRPRQVGKGTALGWDPAVQNRFAWWRFELREDSFGNYNF